MSVMRNGKELERASSTKPGGSARLLLVLNLGQCNGNGNGMFLF